MEERQERADRSADRLDARQSITTTPPTKYMFERSLDGSISYAFFMGCLSGVIRALEDAKGDEALQAVYFENAKAYCKRVKELQAEDASR